MCSVMSSYACCHGFIVCVFVCLHPQKLSVSMCRVSEHVAYLERDCEKEREKLTMKLHF